MYDATLCRDGYGSRSVDGVGTPAIQLELTLFGVSGTDFQIVDGGNDRIPAR